MAEPRSFPASSSTSIPLSSAPSEYIPAVLPESFRVQILMSARASPLAPARPSRASCTCLDVAVSEAMRQCYCYTAADLCISFVHHTSLLTSLPSIRPHLRERERTLQRDVHAPLRTALHRQPAPDDVHRAAAAAAADDRHDDPARHRHDRHDRDRQCHDPALRAERLGLPAAVVRLRVAALEPDLPEPVDVRAAPGPDGLRAERRERARAPECVGGARCVWRRAGARGITRALTGVTLLCVFRASFPGSPGAIMLS
ncbi:hypothetical protein BV25DRAFT_1220239 [Artomyces pyxidatus]|uniref:Uncharacterized protein n=1 Tax=Artomyces pyxidatus TaxID=48021 RepID=A0ACB8SDA3_9AGAM|nr:hypothetical protein BV25DRAFT_1220239 [Artomyces pyxidatus]